MVNNILTVANNIKTIIDNIKTFVINNSDAFRFILLMALAWTLLAIYLVFDEIDDIHTLLSVFIFNFICGFFGALLMMCQFYF